MTAREKYSKCTKRTMTWSQRVINQRKKIELDQCVDKARIQRTNANNLNLKRVIFLLCDSVIMTRKGFNLRLHHQMRFHIAIQSLNI